MTMLETSLSHDSDSASRGVSLWVEKGHNRRDITDRMRASVPSLTIVSTPEQQFPGTDAIAYPDMSAPDAINQFNTLAEEHGITALWPQEASHYDLSGVQIDVHAAASPDVVKLVDDKVAFAEWLEGDKYQPFSAEVIGVEAIADMIAHRRGEGHEVCIKPVIGISGQGYWRLADRPDISVLDQPDRRTIHPDLYLRAMEIDEAQKGPQRMVVMDYLPGPEVSVDLLTWRGEPLVHAARTKLPGRRERIQSEHEVLDHVYEVARKLGFHGIVSMQYRLDVEGNWKMLEINPRPAGGSFYSEDAGFGIVSNWAKLVAGEVSPSDIQQHEGDVTFALYRAWRQETPTQA